MSLKFYLKCLNFHLVSNRETFLNKFYNHKLKKLVSVTRWFPSFPKTYFNLAATITPICGEKKFSKNSNSNCDRRKTLLGSPNDRQKLLNFSFCPSSQSSSFSTSSSSSSLSSFENEDLSDHLFDLISENNSVSCSEIIRNLAACGLWHNDPRLAKFYVRLENRKKTSILPTFHEYDRLSRETFKWLVEGSEVLIKKALCDEFIIPDFIRFCKTLNEIYRDCRTNWGGSSSAWPHEDNKSLGHLNFAGSGSDYWGVSLCTIDGQRHNMGDVDVFFPLHSCSWPFNYSFAIKQLGSDEVHRFVGSETPQNFPPSLSQLFPSSPSSLSSLNPLSLPGSLLISSLLHRNVQTAEKRFTKLLSGYEKLVRDDEDGRVRLNEELHEVVRKRSHNWKSVAHSLAAYNCFPRGTCVEETLNMSMLASCLEVDARSLALMAAYYANGGRCPLSMEMPTYIRSAVTLPKIEHQQLTMTRNTLTFMHSSSTFSRSIHLPICTSLTGAMILVVNGVLGMCLWSPPLNDEGLSCRGIEFCREFVKRFNLQNSEFTGFGVKDDPRVRRSFKKVGHMGELLFAAYRGDLSSLRNMHKSGLNMNARDYDGRTALHVACSEGNLDCVRYLIDECKVDMEAVDRWNHKPLHEATRLQRRDIQDYLVNKINSRISSGGDDLIFE
ncbi:hypothetical protein HELRODRAFT_195098 [Helobdella robusta]|uniref:glutaminase n=1 Tax=Helobdella robusta TaxID=6412 RepID=T1FWQ9_HELRO|nr:hypothetical protein HELRODRAFT_195098 [Helobdella robusta]ESO06750.1 hypothetical protein HELRODRAFT_195098 [Helobdella robusta]